MQRIGILISEFDARVNRIQVAWKVLDAPLHASNYEDIIDEPPLNERLE